MKTIVLVVCQGLPASGKTTWAKAWVAQDPERRARVNQDDIRKMLAFGEWTPDRERRVQAVKHASIRALLNQSLDVVSDDTNLNPAILRYMKVIASSTGTELVMHDFTGVPLETCLERDAGREDQVGAEVIIRMHERYLKGDGNGKGN